MKIFYNESLATIMAWIEEQLRVEATLSFCVLNPDVAEGVYAGETITIEGVSYCYRSLKSWVELAELLQCSLALPKVSSYPLVELSFTKLSHRSFHQESKDSEKYGSDSLFWQIHKMQEPAFYYYYQEALRNVKVERRKEILNLGINRGDEFKIIQEVIGKEAYLNLKLVGVDYSQSAIAYAKANFLEECVDFYRHDINQLDGLMLGKFDLLISIGTLQSASKNFKTFFMDLVQNYLKEDAALILGFPNSRWIGGSMVYGAKAPNYAMSEMSILFNDVMFCKKYLQQKKYRVTLTGKHYIFLTATKITSQQKEQRH
jgi:2-polyprenyl-3-methyl-5-hydroxy-6-metoxy-1,4-benzoquinol methylase